MELRAYIDRPETLWLLLLFAGIAAVLGLYAWWLRRRGWHVGWLAIAPFAVGCAVYFQPLFPQLEMTTLVGGLLALGILVLAVRRPATALVALIALLPYPTVVFSYMLSVGVPVSILRAAASWKEVLGAGILIAALFEMRRTARRLDRIDLIALGFVAFVAIYAIAPRAFVADAPLDTSLRTYGFRTAAAFVLLLFACRHAPFPTGTAQRVGRALLLTSCVVAGIGVVEFLASDWWNRFMIETVQVPTYQQVALGVDPLNPADVRFYSPVAGARVVRLASVILDPVGLGFFLLGGFALALERVVQGATRGFAVGQLVLIGSVLILTQTRSALLGACAIGFLAFGRFPGRAEQTRARLGVVLAAALVVAVPFAGAQGLTQRITESFSGRDEGATIHREASEGGLRHVVTHPLGSGLGTGPGAIRFSDPAAPVDAAHNWYLSIGQEVGIVPMLLFVALTIATPRALRARGASRDPTMAAAARAFVVGVGLGSILIDALAFVPVAWTTWAVAGVALGAQPSRDGSQEIALRRPVAAPA